MKIRIKDNSIRLRLTQSEVAELGKSGVVSCFTEFVNKPFIYALEKSDNEALSAEFIENRIVMKMPEKMVEEFVSTDIVGFNGQTDKIKLLVEKDFVCLDNSDEDQSDNYPNPNMKC